MTFRAYSDGLNPVRPGFHAVAFPVSHDFLRSLCRFRGSVGLSGSKVGQEDRAKV